MTNKRPVSIDHTHEPSTPSYDGFQSGSDKKLLDELRVSKVAYDNTILATKEPTGFTNNQDITVTYNSTTRKITLSGTFEAFYKGVKVREIIDGWSSIAHADVQGTYFLYYCDGGFVFSTTTWDFSCLTIASVQYNSHIIGMREVHGFMPNQVHQEFHNVIGAYLVSGGDLSNFTLNSTTATLRRPVVSDTVLADEDLKSTVLGLSTKSYTQRYLTGSAVRSFFTAQPEIIPVSGSQPYYNLNTGGTWSQVLFSNNSYGAVFVVAVPTTNDSGSQVFRYMFVQPQMNSASLADIQALTPNSLVHGISTALVAEFVFFAKIIIRYTGGNWSIVQVDKLTGTKIAQTSVPAGTYLTNVSHDTTLTGDGTIVSPLGVIGKQDTLVSGSNIKTINGSSILGSGDLAITSIVTASGNVNATVYGSTTAGVGTYDERRIFYERIGNVVTVSMYIQISNHTGTGDMMISGLPYSAKFHTALAVAFVYQLNSAYVGVTARVATNSNVITLETHQMNAMSNIPIDTSFGLMISGSYIIL